MISYVVKIDEGLRYYRRKNGSHFTPSLAEWASRRMVNRNGVAHTWTAEEVMSGLDGLGIMLPSNCTLGDACYLANMYYADFRDLLNSDADCLRMAYEAMSDPDGYDGMHFNRWLADMDGTDVEVNWDNFYV